MAKEKLWYQCHFKQGTRETVAYVDEDCAVIGNTVDLKSDEFPGLWKVTNVSGPGCEYRMIAEAEGRRRNPDNFASVS